MWLSECITITHSDNGEQRCFTFDSLTKYTKIIVVKAILLLSRLITTRMQAHGCAPQLLIKSD